MSTEAFQIAATPMTPEVNYAEGVLSIKGKSLPTEYHDPFWKDLHSKVKNIESFKELSLHFEVFNTLAAREIQDLLVEDTSRMDDLTINRYYDKNYDDMRVAGNDYK